MAGDWLKIRHNLDDDPHVLRMQSLLQLADPDLLIAKLRNLWKHADQHTVDGLIKYADAGTVDGIARCPGLATALVAVGWLEITSDGAQIVRFQEHTGKSAKERALTARRVAKHRASACNGQPLHPPLPREEKRREELGDESPRTPLAPSGSEHSSHSASEPQQAATKAVTDSPSEASNGAGRRLDRDRGGANGTPDQAGIVLLFPVVGGKTRGGPAEWPLTASKLAEYAESFPGVDVLAECRKALQWCRDNPKRQKTCRGIAAFLSRWLGKVQDSGGSKAIPRPHARGETLAEKRARIMGRMS